MRRQEIFRLAASLPVVKVFDLAIPKPLQILEEDMSMVCMLEESIAQQQQVVATPSVEDKKALEDIQVTILYVKTTCQKCGSTASNLFFSLLSATSFCCDPIERAPWGLSMCPFSHL